MNEIWSYADQDLFNTMLSGQQINNRSVISNTRYIYQVELLVHCLNQLFIIKIIKSNCLNHSFKECPILVYYHWLLVMVPTQHIYLFWVLSFSLKGTIIASTVQFHNALLIAYTNKTHKINFKQRKINSRQANVP